MPLETKIEAADSAVAAAAPCSECDGTTWVRCKTYGWTKCKCSNPPPNDLEIMDWLSSLWDSQGFTVIRLMGRDFANPTGSFRDAVAAQMSLPNVKNQEP